MKDYFVHLVPIDEASAQILASKEYKNDKSVADMWRARK